MRPVAPYFGGKWRTAPWIISHFPPHEVYIEPFGGMGSVLLRKPPAFNEVLNDVNGDIVNLFQVLRDPELAGDLIRRLRFTPYAREVYRQAVGEAVAPEPLDRAWAFLVRLHFSMFQRAFCDEKDFSVRMYGASKRPPAHFKNYPEHLIDVTERLKTVIIENLDGPYLIQRYSRFMGDRALVYCDPPYLHSTRACRKGYRHEMTDEDHIRLAEIILSSPMMFVISGYDSGLYNDLYKGWRKAYKQAAPEKECLWFSPNIKEVGE
jgi:DNA adenine methylase